MDEMGQRPQLAEIVSDAVAIPSDAHHAGISDLAHSPCEFASKVRDHDAGGISPAAFIRWTSAAIQSLDAHASLRMLVAPGNNCKHVLARNPDPVGRWCRRLRSRAPNSPPS